MDVEITRQDPVEMLRGWLAKLRKETPDCAKAIVHGLLRLPVSERLELEAYLLVVLCGHEAARQMMHEHMQNIMRDVDDEKPQKRRLN